MDDKARKILLLKSQFHELAEKLNGYLGEKPGREFMLSVVDPDPILDWETGHELGDPCPIHRTPLSTFALPDAKGRYYLKCADCFRSCEDSDP